MINAKGGGHKNAQDPFDVDLFDNIVNLFIAEEVIEVDQLKVKNIGGH